MSAEKSGHELQSLLHAIAQLYSGIINNVVHHRISAYHSEAGNSDDVGAALHEYIIRVKHSTHHSDSPTSTQAGLVEPHSATHTHPHAGSPTENSYGIDNPLSQYLQKNNLDAELATPIGHKLSSSAWDHTQSAIRYAHQGDYANAKLHATLANNAIDELGHYVSPEEFKHFKQAIKTELLGKPEL